MKKILVSGGIYVFVTNEEKKLIDDNIENGELYIEFDKLSRREKLLAKKLHEKGVFSCKKKKDKVYYIINKNGIFDD